MFDEIHDECGVFGIYNANGFNAVHLTYLGLYSLQHRGQISCGIAVNNQAEVVSHKELGIVPEVFREQELKKLAEAGKGDMAIGQVRYSPGELSQQANSQPLVMHYVKGTMALASNGCLVNSVLLRKELEEQGAIFQTSSSVEIIAYLIARSRLAAGSVEQALNQAMDKISGAYSMVIMTPHKLVAVRDPHGFRPLCIGKLEDSFIVSSESCALESIGASFVRDVEPGEIVVIDKNGLRSVRDHCGGATSLCIFEHIYFARPDSVIDGVSVHETRQNTGRRLAKEYPVEADVVIGVPDSGLDAAIGYAEESGIPYELGFVKNRYIGRTFIQNSQAQRKRSVQIKLNPLRSVVQGKRVVLVDDSIVRGTTSSHIIELVRKAGAKEVHVRISSPPFLYPCYFGTDISSKESLIANRMTVEEIGRKIGADSLGYLSQAGLDDICKGSKTGFCSACFSGDYPLPVETQELVDVYDQKLDTLVKKKK